jgi:hypothetical protein
LFFLLVFMTLQEEDTWRGEGAKGKNRLRTGKERKA